MIGTPSLFEWRGFFICFETSRRNSRASSEKQTFGGVHESEIPVRNTKSFRWHVTVVTLFGVLVSGSAGIGGEPEGLAGYAGPGIEPQIFAPGLISTEAYEFAVTFTPDMEQMYFTRRQGPGANHILAGRLVEGGIEGIRPASFSVASGEFEPCVAPDGRRIYFGQDGKIKFCDRKDGGWSAARELPDAINGRWAMALWADRGGNLYFTRDQGLVVSRPDGGGYADAVSISSHLEQPAGDAAHGYFDPDLSYVVFDSQGRAEGKGRADLYVSFRNPDGAWTDPRNLDVLNTAGTEMCASVTPDGRFLFFSRDGDIYWVEAAVLDQYR